MQYQFQYRCVVLLATYLVVTNTTSALSTGNSKHRLLLKQYDTSALLTITIDYHHRHHSCCRNEEKVEEGVYSNIHFCFCCVKNSAITTSSTRIAEGDGRKLSSSFSLCDPSYDMYVVCSM